MIVKLFIFKFLSVILYVYTCLKLFFVKMRIKNTKNNWRITRNNNYYNSTFAATVFKHGSIWKIARHNKFFGAFYDKNDAMNLLFEEWLKETKVLDSVASLQGRLKDFKEIVFETFKNEEDSEIDEEMEEIQEDREETETHFDGDYRLVDTSENDINFISKYFYLGQAEKKCFKCKKNILVNAVILPSGFESIDYDAIDLIEQKEIDLEVL